MQLNIGWLLGIHELINKLLWKNNFAIISILMIQSDINFAHAVTG